MDNVTHTLFAATLARTPLSRAGRGTTAALILASNAPDIDIVATAGGAANYLTWHRGLTHGPLGVVGLGVVSAAIVWTGRRVYDQRRARHGADSTGPTAWAAPTPDAPPIESWPRHQATPNPVGGKRCLVEIAAMPSFTSPFSWRIIAQMSNAYEIHDIDLLDRRFRELEDESDVPWRLTLRYPNVWTSAVEKAAGTRVGQVFLGFSRFPAARSVVDGKGITTVRWSDMRFAGRCCRQAKSASFAPRSEEQASDRSSHTPVI